MYTYIIFDSNLLHKESDEAQRQLIMQSGDADGVSGDYI